MWDQCLFGGLMMAPNDEDIASRIILTPAERTVLMEQLDTLKVSADAMRRAVVASKGTAMTEAWVQMGESMNYVGTILNLKGTAAIRQFLHETGG